MHQSDLLLTPYQRLSQGLFMALARSQGSQD